MGKGCNPFLITQNYPTDTVTILLSFSSLPVSAIYAWICVYVCVGGGVHVHIHMSVED